MAILVRLVVDILGGNGNCSVNSLVFKLFLAIMIDLKETLIPVKVKYGHYMIIV